MRKTKQLPLWVDWLGWIGVALVLGAYGLLSFGIIPANLWFQVPTLLGSLAVAVQSWLKRDKQPVVLNIIFALIAIVAIFRLLILP